MKTPLAYDSPRNQLIISIMIFFILLFICIVARAGGGVILYTMQKVGITNNNNPVVETCYQGTGPLDLMFTCIQDKDGKEKITDNLWGVFAANLGSANQGNWWMELIPSTGIDHATRIGWGTITDKGALITCGFDYIGGARFAAYITQYPKSIWHMTWTNPDNIAWKLTMYRRAR